MTHAQHTALAHLSDGEWRMGHDMATSAVTLSRLERAELIRCDFDHKLMMERYWTITPRGLEALERCAA